MCSLERLLKGCELKPNYSIRFPQYLTQQEVQIVHCLHVIYKYNKFRLFANFRV